MSDFTVSVGIDYGQMLSGFQQVEQAAARSGQAAGQALGGSIERNVNRSIDVLLQELGRLNAAKVAPNVDGGQVIVLNGQIAAIKNQINSLRAARVAVAVDPRSIDGLRGRLQDLQGELERVAIGSQRFKELQASIKAAEAELAKAGQSAGGLRDLDGLVQGVAFSLTNTLVNAVGTAVQSLSTIPAQVSEWGAAKAAASTLGVDAEDLGQRMLKLSQEMRGNISANELLKASYDVLSSGFSNASDVTNVMSASANLASGGFTSMAVASDGLTSALNAYGMSADQAAVVADKFIQTQNDGKITVGQYAQQIGQIAPTAYSAGVSIDELNAAISAATAQGVPVGSTFAGMRQAIASILKPSAEASKYAKSLGIDYSAAALKAKGFGAFMDEVAKKTGGSAEAIIKLTGSVEAQAALQPLVNDGLAKYNTFLQNQAGSAGAAARAADAATNTISKSLDRLRNSLSNVAVQSFQGLEKPAVAVINAINGVVGALSRIPGPAKAVIGVVAGLATAYLAARTAASLFGAVLQTTQVQSAISFFRSLATTIAGDFRAAIVAAKVEWQMFTLQVQNQGLLSAIGGIGRALLGMAGQVAVVALRFAYIAAAVEAYRAITGAADEASQGYSERLKATQKALDLVKGSTDAVSGANDKLTNSSNGVIKFFENLPAVLRVIAAPLEGVVRLFYVAVEGFARANALNTIGDQAAQLQAKFTEVQQAAQKTFNELKNATKLTPEQAKSVQDRIAALKAIKEQAEGQAKAYADLAVAYRAAGKNDMAKIAENNANSMRVEADVSDRLMKGLEGITDRTKAKNTAVEAGIAKTQEQIQAEAELNRVIGQAPIRSLEARLAIGQQLVNLAKAAADVEQSRFSVTRSRLQFELQALQDRGAGEGAIAAKKAEIDANERAAIAVKYQTLIQQQALEMAILQINQEKARLEAEDAVGAARQKRLAIELSLAQASNDVERQKYTTALAFADQEILRAQERVNLLAQTQPLEAAVASLQREQAMNGIQAEAAAKGLQIAADGTMSAMSALAQYGNQVSVATFKSAEEQNRFLQIAKDSGIAVQSVNDETAVFSENQQAASKVADELKSKTEKTGTAATALAGAFGTVGTSAATAAGKASGIADPFAKVAGAGADVAKLNLPDIFSKVAGSTQSAAGSARVFYEWLQKAASLPAARWSGGPVEAGGEYRINELGQEAFLAAGRLSLIDAPANSVWRAPSAGVVIPAGITARLQGTAPLTTGSGLSGVAELAVEVGNLRQEVAGLARKDWSIHVQQRTGPTASQVMNQIHRLR